MGNSLANDDEYLKFAEMETDDAELAFLCFISQASAHFSQRLHMLIAACFTVALIVTWRDAQSSSILTAIVQAAVVAHQVFQGRLLFLNDPASEIRRHMVKTKMHVFLHLAIIAMMALSSGDTGGTGGTGDRSPWLAMAFLSFVSLADRLPLDHLALLQIVKVAGFLGSMTLMRGVDLRLRDAATCVTIAGLTYLMGAHAEFRARDAYARNHHETSDAVYTKFVDGHPLLASLFRSLSLLVISV